MSLMTWACPGFKYLFYNLLNNNGGEMVAVPSRSVPIAATDGRNIIINPDRFFKLPLKQQIFALGHEIIHNVFGDVEFLHRCGQAGTVPMSDGTTRPFINKMMQHAMDYRINALLQDSRIGEVIPGICLDPEVGKASDGVVDIYKKMYDDAEADGRIIPGNSFDQLLQPGASTGQSPSQAVQSRNGAQWQVETAAAHHMEKVRDIGKMSMALSRFFEQILNPVVPWTDHIKGIFNRKVGSGTYNWRKPDRRFITRDLYMPSRSGNGAGWVVVWADTSGSIGNDELCRYMAELTEIMESCQPKRLTICWCDSAIQRIDELEEPCDMDAMKTALDDDAKIGGGGTDMLPVLEWIDQQTERPEIMIAFTDGYVHFPEAAPDFLMIWASTTNVEYPFGDVVRINPEAA